eukprot:maker-scaffold1581_size34907-snap-gene-0.8 protein:Tk03698 transcript:maker-scaffold1581_size34907-snap-gene-0.8-mRNA-1 annotation:"rna-directed dna polymerase from mobile element jockey-like"
MVLMANLPDCLSIGDECNVGYADDVSIWAVGKDLPTVKSFLNQRAEGFARFAAGNGLIMNASKTHLMLGGKVQHADLEDFHVVVDGVTVFPDKKLEVSSSARACVLSPMGPSGQVCPAAMSSLHAVAMETWRAFRSQDGPDGSRNALGQVLFPSNVATRSTRSEAAGVVSPHLPFAANTLVDNGIAMWISSQPGEKPGEMLTAFLFMAVIGVIINSFTLRSILGYLTGLDTGLYRILYIDSALSLAACVLSAFVCIAFLLDYHPEWICFSFLMSVFPTDFQSLLAGVAISATRYWNVSGSPVNRPPMGSTVLKGVSVFIVGLSFGYIIGLYLLMRAMDTPWTVFLETCRSPQEPRIESPWTNLLFGPPLIGLASATLISDISLMRFLRKYSNENQNLHFAVKIPIMATVMSAIWILPLVTIALLLLAFGTSAHAEVTMLFLYYRVSQMLRSPLMFWLTFCHRKKKEAEQKRILEKEQRLKKVIQRAWSQMREEKPFQSLRVVDLETGVITHSPLPCQIE